MKNLEIGERIRYLREKQGLTQQELADACDIGVSQIGYIERGKRFGSITSMNQIARKLSVSLDYLLSGETESYIEDAIVEIRQHIKRFSKRDVDQIIAIIKAYKP